MTTVSRARKAVIHVLLLFPIASGILAKEIPLKNWTVPPLQGVSPMGEPPPNLDLTNGLAFVGVQPCRIVDTRAAAGFPAGYGPPSLAQGNPRHFALNASPHCAGLPFGLDAYSLNITVTNTAGPGFILIYPFGSAQPTVSTLNYVAGQTTSNAAIVPAGDGGAVTVVAGVSGTDVIIDINGYFTDEYANNTRFRQFSFLAHPAVEAVNVSALEQAIGLFGWISSQTPGGASSAVRGLNSGLGSQGVGVWGQHAGSGWGVFGDAVSGYGVYGKTAAGLVAGNFPNAGVRGETTGTGIGVMALTTSGYSALSGYRVVGGAFGTGADIGFSSVIGLRVTGNTTATGTKAFVEPHPTNASKIIQYVSLEGNEAGTYFRGRGKFQNGIARIRVPEDFRIVTDSEDLTVQITPIGGMATVGVLKLDLVEIVAQSSRDLEFSYLVQGVRRAYKDVGPIGENEKMFVPASADERLPEYLPLSLRERLISNGTFRPDGTVNMETARRLGWDRMWAEHSRPGPQ